MNAASIPVLSLAPPPGDSRAPAVARQLVAACHEVGFCYLASHGIDPAVERAAMDATRAFFRLPDADKRALSIARSPHFRGYTPLGNEVTRGRPDWREQLDLGADESSAAIGPGDPPWRRLRGPNQWPAALPQMQPAIEAWCAAMAALALRVLRLLAAGLGQAPDYFDRYMLPRGDPHLKLIRYCAPPATESGSGGGAPLPLRDGADGSAGQGVGWHHDSGLLTFILQDDAGGLEVRTPAGTVAAAPVAGAYLLNLGEMMQRATAGYLRATEHRVVSPRGVNERISLAYFAHPKLESRFEPVPLPPALAAQAPGGENADPSDPVFAVFGENYLKIRLRSHADVAARFYADVR